MEAGSRFVTVFWDEYGLAGSGWDTHWDHYPRMREELLPGLDRAWAGLIADLDSRGMLDDTLVLCVSEHGRTPHIQNVKGGGRDHWSQAYSSLFAGGGVARGRIVGKSDKIGGTVVDRPVSPKDILATLYHLLGIDHHHFEELLEGFLVAFLDEELQHREPRAVGVDPAGDLVGELLRRQADNLLLGTVNEPADVRS